MKYFIYILFFLTPILSYLCWVFFRDKIKISFIKSLIKKNADKETQKNHLSLFEDILFEMAAKLVGKAKKKNQTKLISDLQNGNTESFFKLLEKKEPLLAYALKEILHYQGKIIKQPKKSSSSVEKTVTALIHESTYEYSLIIDDLKNMSFHCSRKQKAIRKLLYARHLFFTTDLKKASEVLLKTAKDFRKEKLFNELAYTYFMLGSIYRTCGAFDAAEMMFSSALGIYKKTNHSFGQNFILAELGINCMGANRYEEADSYFTKAIHAHKKNKDILHEAEILNRQALLSNVRNAPQKAIKQASEAVKKHKLVKNKAGIAFSLEQIAIAYGNMQNLKKAASYANQAKKVYISQKNYAAYCDSLEFLIKLCLDSNDITNAKKHFNALKYCQKKHSTHFLLENLKKLGQDIKCHKS